MLFLTSKNVLNYQPNLNLNSGLATADRGSVTVLGEKLVKGTEVLTTPQMMGYCHRSEALIEDLTVEEHFTMFIKVSLRALSNKYSKDE